MQQEAEVIKREPTQTQEEHANCTQKGASWELNLLLGDSGNRHSGVLPPDEVTEKINSTFGRGTNEEPSQEGQQDVG